MRENGAHLFSQLLREHFPRFEFDRPVRKHEAERDAKGFTCWTQLVAMLFRQLGRADSLREICGGLACCIGKLSHLAIRKAPNKSTLSYANRHRPAALFEELFWTMAERFRASGALGARRKKRFRFKNKLLSLDSTTIALCLSLFPWARFRRAKVGVKVHVLLDHDDYMPSYVLVSEARRHDIVAARLLELNPGSIVAFDRAYNDSGLFGKWTRRGVYCVTRMKSSANYEVLEVRALARRGNVLSDEIIRLTGVGAWAKCPHHLRRIVVWDEATDRRLVLLTNHLEFGSTSIAGIYKDRWEIETFFKTLKQSLKVKTFVGTSENALLIQIWTALIALLLLKCLQHLSRAARSFSNRVIMLRLNLFIYRNLRDWLRDPFGQGDAVADDSAGVQLELPLPGLGQPAET